MGGPTKEAERIFERVFAADDSAHRMGSCHRP